MKKILFAVSMCLMFSCTVFAQFFIETEIGYSLALNKDALGYENHVIFNNVTNGDYYHEIIPNKFSIMQSPFVSVIGGYKFKKIELSLGLSYSDNKAIKNLNLNNSHYIDESRIWSNEDDVWIFVNKELNDCSYYSRGYYIFPEVAYSFETKHVTIKPLLGISFKFLAIDEVSKITRTFGNPNSNGLQDSIIEVYNYELLPKNNFNNLFGLRAGLSIAYNINNNFSLSCKLSYNYGTTYSIAEKTQVSHETESMGNAEIIDNNSYTFYSNEAFNVNTLNFSLGLRYYIGGKSKGKE